MDSMLDKEVITCKHMPDQLLAVTEMVTMDFSTSKEKIFLHSYEGPKTFSLWYQKLVEMSLLSVHEWENFPQIGKKTYRICPMKQAWKRELLHHRRAWSQYYVPEWLEILLLFPWPKWRTLSWRDQDFFSFSEFKHLFFALAFPQKSRWTWLARNSSSQKHRAFLFTGRANLRALSHRDSPGVMF